MLGLAVGKVSLCGYDPRWPHQYDAERVRLQALLGVKAVAVEHVGSTAVPGMIAKPLIDIMVGLESLADVPPSVPLIESLGYAYKGEFGIPDRHFFVLGDPTTTHHMHMVFFGGPFWRLNLLFRDYLRANPHEARAYEALKQRLALEFADNREAYTKGKDAFIKGVLARAGWSG